MTNDVFAYGEFLKDPVLRRILGRVPQTTPAKLRGYRKFLDDLLGFYNLVHEEEGVVEGQLLLDIPEILHEEDVSITILNRAPVLFQFRVLETGRPLLCRDPIALADFTEEVISRHADFIIDYEQFVKEYDAALRERYVHDR